MKIRNILKRSGGVDTKLKSKISKTWKTVLLYILAVYIALTLCFRIYRLIDIDLNGKIVDWFTSNCMRTIEYSESGMPDNIKIYIREPIWYKIKTILLATLCITAVLFITVTFMVSRIYSAMKVKKTKDYINKMFQAYMIDDKEIENDFVEENAELFTKMTSVKTSVQKSEQMLKDEAARKNDLIVYLAHDLKTPLTSVIGYLSLLNELPDIPEKQREQYINITLDKAIRLEKLINEFFDITRYNLQSIILEKEQIDLHYMLVQMTDEFYPILKHHGNTISLTADENLLIYGDPERLARVFNNILKNAVAYSYPNTEIQISTELNGDNVNIYFRNKGKTIPRHKLDAIFEKFFRLDESRSTNTGGSGLGLAIASEIVTLHGGAINADSENELTTFCVTLPVTRKNI